MSSQLVRTYSIFIRNAPFEIFPTIKKVSDFQDGFFMDFEWIFTPPLIRLFALGQPVNCLSICGVDTLWRRESRCQLFFDQRSDGSAFF